MGFGKAMLWGGVAVSYGYFSANYLLNAAATKIAIFNAYLARSPELTDKVLEAANQAATQAASGSATRGFLYAIGAGVTATVSLSHLFSIGEENKQKIDLATRLEEYSRQPTKEITE